MPILNYTTTIAVEKLAAEAGAELLIVAVAELAAARVIFQLAAVRARAAVLHFSSTVTDFWLSVEGTHVRASGILRDESQEGGNLEVDEKPRLLTIGFLVAAQELTM